MIEEKTKEVGDIRKKEKVIANAVQFLNGEDCFKFAKVPIILLDYKTPENAHSFAKGDRFKFWIKVEGAEWKNIVKQLKPDLKEISIWFDKENIQKIKEFLNKEDDLTK